MSKTVITAAIAAGAALSIAACGGNEPSSKSGAAAAPVRIVASGDRISAPSHIRGGVVEMEFVNAGRELHEYAIGYVDPPHTVKQLVDLSLDPKGGEPPAWAHDIGGVPALSPGQRVTITRRLRPGTYGVLDFAPGRGGKPHIAFGGWTSFTVAGDSGRRLPRPTAVIEAGDKSFATPRLRAGRATVELRNAARGEREFNLFRLAPGRSIDDAEAWIRRGGRGPAPFVALGAMQSIPSGTSVFLGIDLQPGTYVVSDEEHGTRATFDVAE